MEENKRSKNLFIIGSLILLLTVVSATYAYFSVTTVNNFGTSTINATAGPIGSVTLNGNNATLSMDLTALDMVKGSDDITYYAGTSGKTTTPTEVTLGTASITPTSDDTRYYCTYTLSVTHTGTNDMYNAFNHQTNNTYDYTERGTNQIVLTINGVDYDFYNAWPTSNQVTESFSISGSQTKDITASLRFTNRSNINQSYLADTDISISISLVNNSLSCTAVEPMLTYANPGTCNTLTPGCEVTIGGDNFYVVSSAVNGDTLLLSKYDIKSDGNGSYMQDTSGTSTNIVKSMFMDSNNKVYWTKGMYIFSEPFWVFNEMDSESYYLISPYNINGANYCTTASGTNCAYVYDYNNIIYPYVNSYTNKIATNAKASISGRLMSLEEANTLKTAAGANIVKDKNNYNYWLGTVKASTQIWYVNSSGTINYISGEAPYSIRPVLVIPTEDLS